MLNDLRALSRDSNVIVMYPYSYTCETLPPHAEDLIEASLGAAKANKAVHGMPVITGSACELLYAYVLHSHSPNTKSRSECVNNVFVSCSAPGSVIDWAYAEAGITFSYSVFLRDTGTVCHHRSEPSQALWKLTQAQSVWFFAPSNVYSSRRRRELSFDPLSGPLLGESK